MSTLVLSPRLTADSEALGAAARDAGWVVERLTSWRPPERLRSQDVAIYGEALFAEVVAAALDLVLIEAPPHWLESLPEPYLRRRVWHSTLGEAREQSAPVVVKPAAGKSFPAAVYASGIDLPDESHTCPAPPPCSWPSR